MGLSDEIVFDLKEEMIVMSVNPLELYNKNWLDDEKMLIMEAWKRRRNIIPLIVARWRKNSLIFRR